MTQPPGGGPNRPSPQEPTDPPRAAQPEPDAGGQPVSPAPPAPPVPLGVTGEPAGTSGGRADTAERTVEFGQAGFPTPPGYPAYGSPVPRQPAQPPVTGHAPSPPPNAPPDDPAPGGEASARPPGRPASRSGADAGTVEYGVAGFPTPPGYPAYGQQPPAGLGPPPPAGYGSPPGPGHGQPPEPDARPAPSRKRRGVVIASIALVAALLLCGGGGLAAFLLLRDEGGEGAPEPVAAADGFLRAVYLDQDADKAMALVCAAARDRAKIVKKVDEVRAYRDTYKNPRFRWAPPSVTEQDAERAVVSTKLTMITGDDRFSEQRLTITVVRQSGWWVCEVA